MRATDERRRDPALALRRDEAEARAPHRVFDLARRDIGGTVQAVEQHALPLPSQFVGQAHAVLVIAVDDRDARALAEAAVEEAALGIEVALHRAVVVEVVARQVREGRDLGAQSVAASEV